MEIKILGTGCPNCISLEKRVRLLVKRENIQATIVMVKDIMEIMKYGVMSTPALVVNEKVVAKGRVPKDNEILGWLSV